MILMIHRKLSVALLRFVLVLTVVFSLSACEARSFAEADYRTDLEPLTSQFSEVGPISRAWWKVHGFGSMIFSGIGPASYAIAGFMEVEDWGDLDMADFSEPLTPDFAEGMDPSVTGVSDLTWQNCPALTDKILANRYIGEVYADIEHRLIYFTAEPL